MIKLTNTSVTNFENAIRGARNPMNSWDKSDTFICNGFILKESKVYKFCEEHNVKPDIMNKRIIIGESDMDLMKRLIKAGTDHRKFMRQIFVSVDINAPLYWWKEYDTYKVGTVANSCSTMHKIHSKEFELDDFSHEHLQPREIELLKSIIANLNENRESYNWCNTETKKDRWWQMIQLLPTSYNQLRTCTLNYENLLNIYNARKNHKLDEWHTFCDWIETLPYANELIVQN